MEGICIGIDSRVTESCTNAQGEYTLFDLSERLYMIDVFHCLSSIDVIRPITKLITSPLSSLIPNLTWSFLIWKSLIIFNVVISKLPW